MPKRKKRMTCPDDHMDCFAYGSFGKCNALTDTEFSHHHKCPFYKTSFERKKGHIEAVKRLVEMGREDLLEKYGGGEEQAKIWERI